MDDKQKGPVKTFLQAELNVHNSVQLLHSFSTQRLRLTPASLSLDWLVFPIFGQKAIESDFLLVVIHLYTPTPVSTATTTLQGFSQ